eukprot:gene2832-3125_t
MVKATTADGKEVELDVSRLKFSLGAAVDEETFRRMYGGQADKPQQVMSVDDLQHLAAAGPRHTAPQRVRRA